jgi:hypothetical protein
MIVDKSNPGAIRVKEAGLDDDDEMIGPEWDAAVSSPIKGKGRLTSTVVSFTFFV